MKRYSIIFPVYNIEAYIERAVVSAMAAAERIGPENCEFILVNDGSLDGSAEVCNRIQKQYPDGVRVVHKENGGLASARNAGLQVADAEYVLFVDGDDWINANTLEKLDTVISQYRPDVIKYGYTRVENGAPVYSDFPGLDERYYEEQDMMTAVYPKLLGNGQLFNYDNSFLPSVCMAAYRLNVIRDHNILFQSERVILNEDLLFNMELFLKVKSLYVIRQSFYNYDCREGSLTQCYKPQMYERKLALFEYYERLAQQEDLLSIELLNSRYTQFVIQHIYDCAVMEVLWNPDSNSRNHELKKILCDRRFCAASRHLKGLTLSPKARVILSVMCTRSPSLFYYLYRLVHGKGK